MTPLLCIAGTLCDARLFAPVLAALGEVEATLVTIEHADVRAAGAVALSVAPPHFVAVGFSLGGFVALELARCAPQRIAGVALIASNARADPPENAAIRRAQVERFASAGPEVVADEIRAAALSPANQARKDVRAVLVAMAGATPPERFAAQAELAIARPDSRPDLPHMAMPVLAIHGAKDRMCPPDRGEEIVAGVPHGALAIVPEAGHFAPLEAPEAVANAVAAWRERERLR